MRSTKNFLIYIAALQFLLVPLAVTEKVVVDLLSDNAKDWLEVTCLYAEDYNDFWAYGYPVELVGDDDVYPAQTGFFTPGVAETCEIHYYYGGGQLPLAKSVSFGMYLKGTPEIVVSSKYNPFDDDFSTDIGRVSDGDGNGWFEAKLDLTNHKALVFKFTLKSKPGDLLLLDKIIFDLGDDTSIPTTTTSNPIDDDGTVTLDTDGDYWLPWEEDCDYLEHYSYFWAYGCPRETKEESDEVGYWSTCSTNEGKFCRLRFKGDAAVLPYTPNQLKIRHYLDGNAKIKVNIQSNHDKPCVGGCTVIAEITASNPPVWVESTLRQRHSADDYTINIELLPGDDGGIVIVDKVMLRQPLPGEITTTTTPATTPDDTTPSGTDAPPDDSSAGRLQEILPVLFITTMGAYLLR